MAKAKPTPTEEISEDLAGAELTLETNETEDPKVDYVNNKDNFVFDENGNCLGHKSRDYRSLSKK